MSIQNVSGTPQIVASASKHVSDHQSATETLTLAQAAQLLGISEGQVLTLIDEHTLCAELDGQTYSWLVDANCARAQKESVGAAYPISAPTWAAPSSVPIELPSPEEILGQRAENALSALWSYTGLIDMTPPVSEWQDSDIPWAGLLPEQEKAPLRGLDREVTTQRNVESVMESLDFANVRLEGAMYRIGYLESQVESLQEQLSVLPDFRARAARAILTERENVQLKEQVQAQEAELNETHQLLQRLSANIWFRFLSWLFGITLPAAKTEQ